MRFPTTKKELRNLKTWGEEHDFRAQIDSYKSFYWVFQL